jgi:hypothetical protein
MKKFNVTGTCIPEKHYMVDISKKINSIINLIEEGEYFIINRPRQYGKTTTLYLLDKKLRNMDKYLSIKISFESIDTESYKEVKLFLRSVMKQIKNYFRFSGNENMYDYIEKVNDKIDTMDAFSDFVTDMVEYTNKRIVLIIDEVDKSSNNQLFLDFLGMLRNKYLLKNQGEDYSFHSLILAGVHDVKSLKAKIRPEDEKKYNSPWNIAVNFEVDLSFKAIEIETMLKQYAEERRIAMDYSKLSDKLYYYTSGYPFLVSRLCQIVDEKLLKPDEKSWTVQHIDESVKYILKETNTLFDDLGKNLENNVKLYEEVYSIVIDGEIRVYNNLNPIINLGTIYGIFKEYDNKVMIHNRIYEQLIYNYMISKTEAKVKMGSYNFRDKFINNDNELDFNKILLKFQQFIKEQYSDIDESN